MYCSCLMTQSTVSRKKRGAYSLMLTGWTDPFWPTPGCYKANHWRQTYRLLFNLKITSKYHYKSYAAQTYFLSILLLTSLQKNSKQLCSVVQHTPSHTSSSLSEVLLSDKRPNKIDKCVTWSISPRWWQSFLFSPLSYGYVGSMQFVLLFGELLNWSQMVVS